MTASEILQLALALSKFVRDMIGRIPADELTPEQIQSLREERDALNDAWEDLAP